VSTENSPERCPICGFGLDPGGCDECGYQEPFETVYPDDMYGDGREGSGPTRPDGYYPWEIEQ
jgi:hypothetical protein